MKTSLQGLALLIALVALSACQPAAEPSPAAEEGVSSAESSEAPAEAAAASVEDAAPSEAADAPAAPYVGLVSDRKAPVAAPRRPSAPQGRVEPVLSTPRRG